MQDPSVYTLRSVVPSHETTISGVRFNVETVGTIGKTLKVLDDNLEGAQSFAKSFYEKERSLKIVIEATSLASQPSINTEGSFLLTALTAFASHYPLSIRPDDIWVLMSYAFSRHVNANAEKLRSRFVAHEGKKVLTVNLTPADLTPGQSSSEAWQRVVFPDFSRQIREHIGGETHDMIAQGYSTTTAVDHAAFEITLMSAMQSYFGYKMRTCSGIPWIELQGTLQDWVNIRSRCEKMFGEFMPEYAALLLPVLDEFIAAYQNQVNHLFWQSMIKRIKHGEGSGSYSTISGWVSILYPFLENKPNKLRRWQDMHSNDGPEPTDFPSIVSSVPVEWNYLGEQLLLHFHAGMFGYTQNPDTLALSTNIGWVVTRNPPSKPADRIAAIEKELEDYTKSGNKDYSTKYWINTLTTELDQLKKKQ